MASRVGRVDKTFRKPILRMLSIPLWYIFFRVSKLDTLTMGSKLSCCFHVKKTPPAAEQELEALRDIQVKVDCTTAINFAPLNSPWKYVFHASFKPLSSINNLHIRQSLVRQKSSLTGIKAPTTTPLGSGVPTSLSTTCQRPRRRGVGLPQLLHTLPLVLGPKEEWTRGEWNPGWGELMPIDMSKDLLLSGQCRKWKIFFLCSKRDRCRWRIVFLQSWPTANYTQF